MRCAQPIERQAAASAVFVGAGSPAKQAPRLLARAVPVFAGKLAPTVIAQAFRFAVGRFSPLL
ncbi:hypothetical protein DV532_17310 [Pseudomonas sp. Leaf58]|nr:hypothetical protein DV532_17310 [Pseudomonas sp. Leaf58]